MKFVIRNIILKRLPSIFASRYKTNRTGSPVKDAAYKIEATGEQIATLKPDEPPRQSSPLKCPRNVVQDASTTTTRPYDEIPKKRGLLSAQLGLLLSGGPGYLHEHCHKRHRELGSIFREQLGSAELVFIANTKMIQTVIANEGHQPRHNVPEAWLLYNQVRHIDRGLFFQVGETWSRLRQAFNKVMLADAKMRKFTDDIIKVNNDLIDYWLRDSRLRECDDNSFVIKDIKYELCKWSIEATGLMLFGKRMGCLADDSTDPRAMHLVSNVAKMFNETSKFQIIPAKVAHKLNLRSWQRFVGASDAMLRLANEYADRFIAAAKSPESSNDDSILKDLLNLNSLSDDEISKSMVDLIIAAADTTSNSLQWILYILARHPEAQNKILLEIRQLHNWTSIKTTSTPYLNGFVKEVARLYPTAPFLARTLDHTIALGGYKVPAGKTIVFSLFTTSRMEEYFTEPLAFKPERWLRGGRNSSGVRENLPLESPGKQHLTHAHASLPFGIGSRMCIGRRMAELEIHLLIASIVSRFEVHMTEPTDEVKIKLKMILCPDKPISIRLKAR